MKKNNIKRRRNSLSKGYILRGFVTLLAIANLALLFVFDYNVPGIRNVISKIENKRDHVDGVKVNQVEVEDTGSVTIDYEEETLVYSGKGTFDATADVTVYDADGNELSKDNLTATITGEGDKKIEYTYVDAEDPELTATASRDLELEDYEGPSITLTGTLPLLTDDNLGKLAEICKDCYKAEDGFGHDITKNVKISAAPTNDYNEEFDVTFTVTNVFGDTANISDVASIDFRVPHMKLMDKEITIKRGSKFEALEYVVYAVDYTGANLMGVVEFDGNVDTNTRGDYTVNYDVSNDDGDAVKTKVLTVHVVD